MKHNFTFLIIAVMLLIGLDYVGAWTAPGGNPPSQNVAAPVHTGTSTQTKAGNLAAANLFANTVSANDRMYSDWYCNLAGTDCIDAATLTSLTSGGGGAAPTGAVMAFNLSTCPAGWVAADGSAGTPDLRGTFVRGINGNANGRDVARGLGSYQTDELAGHRHTVADRFTAGIRAGGVKSWESVGSDYAYTITRNTSLTGGSETRPKNVALLYCVKS